MVPDQAGDGLREFIALAAKRPAGKSGQDLGILFPFDHGFQDRASRHAHDVRHHGSELHVRQFEHLGHPGNLFAPVP